MINVEKLKKKMSERGVDAKSVSAMAGISESTFYRKLTRANSSFTVEEAQKIVSVLNLCASDATEIFFNGKLA